ncbi:hypothetical protein PINS_up013381 [Pythium insidiosum]|nr:hypothetical protein PINS_up013381 [Pythium insidiosum]
MADNSPRPALYVVLSNTSGKQNLGTYLRTATAFGATQVIVVGSQRFGTHGAHRAHKYVDIIHFYKYAEAREYLLSQNCAIVGIAQRSGQVANSSAVHEAPFTGSTAFVVDNENPGLLSPEQMAICDAFVHVPFHGVQPSEAPALDATVVTAITLHHFTKWAAFPVRAFEATSTQGKFVLDDYPTVEAVKQDRRAQEVAAARLAHRSLDVDELIDPGLANIFG